MKLKEIRESKRISQKQLCEILEFKPTTYNGYEKGVAEPNISTLIKLADFYKVTLDELVGHEVPYLINKSLLTDKQTKLIEYVTQLTDSQCDKVEAFIMGISMAEIERQNIIQKFNK